MWGLRVSPLTTSNNMKIVSWNVNGLRAVHRKHAFNEVFALSPDIVCIQETKATEEQLPDEVRTVAGYYSFFNSAQDKKGYSGTAIYSKQKPLSVSYNLPEAITKAHGFIDDGYGEPNREGRVITAEFGEYYVVTVYTPNSKEDLSRLALRHQQWDPAFLEYCVTLQNEKPVIFCGDFNVAHEPLDLARPKENEGKKGYTTEEREAVDNMLAEGFVDTLRVLHGDTPELYTWWSPWGGARERNVGWRLDYIFVSDALEDALHDAAIHRDILGSDHCPVSAQLTL